MSKKKSRKRRSGRKAVNLPRASRAVRAASRTEFTPDYTYIIKDLKRIAVLTVFFISLLIVLSFVLN